MKMSVIAVPDRELDSDTRGSGKVPRQGLNIRYYVTSPYLPESNLVMHQGSTDTWHIQSPVQSIRSIESLHPTPSL